MQKWWTKAAWPAPRGVHAAFSLRTGGTSAPPWSSLNLGTHVGDDPAAVTQNRRRLALALDLPTEPLWLEQVHGAEVWRPLPEDFRALLAALECDAGGP